ncbi:craniofacial development protein 2-like [Diorhabda carinulata]|uniref:craniofacial development protein 2-like n=1 Tax=Diorhabda carinulata TaxID=1163345 RepID=UPI0025A2EDC3|nr:craniofacial development protein 2-like [Diorhabda carinulata]
MEREQRREKNSEAKRFKKLIQEDEKTEETKGQGQKKNDSKENNSNRKIAVKTLLRTEKMEELAKEIEKYNIDITTIQETRWEKEGEIKKEKYIFPFTGEAKRGNGVGFCVRKEIRNCIVDFEPVNGRIPTLRLELKNKYVTVINIYAPAEVAQEKEKDDFYEELSQVGKKIPKKITYEM